MKMTKKNYSDRQSTREGAVLAVVSAAVRRSGHLTNMHDHTKHTFGTHAYTQVHIQVYAYVYTHVYAYQCTRSCTGLCLDM